MSLFPEYNARIQTQMSTQMNKAILPVGSCRGNYKPKTENIKKLKVYLNKLENGK